MAKSWKDIANRANEKYEAERQVWEDFRSKLESIQSFIEAELLVAESPPPESPGRKYYSNLGFFLTSFIVPCDANATERSLYIQLIQRLDATGIIKKGEAANVVNALQKSLNDYPYP
jgi:hypothetical protein